MAPIFLPTPLDLPQISGNIPPNAYSTKAAANPRVGRRGVALAKVGRVVRIMEGRKNLNLLFTYYRCSICLSTTSAKGMAQVGIHHCKKQLRKTVINLRAVKKEKIMLSSSKTRQPSS
jgi:hypothetical protein